MIAICGTGMSALAGLLKERGCVVAGSDIAAYPPVGDLLKSQKIPVHIGYDIDDLTSFSPDYVVIGNFVRKDNPQALYVLERNIPYGSFPSTLENAFLSQTKNIVVVGTHGKTTTTSCTAYLLSQTNKDPSFFIGGVAQNFSQSFHGGRGEYFVLEGDEYDTAFFDKESKFLHYRPWVGIFTSMEWDHADIFATPQAMEAMFRKFVRLIPENGTLFYCRDWESVHELVKGEKIAGKVASFGFHSQSDIRIESFQESPEGIRFRLQSVEFQNSMLGSFNAQNFVGAVLAAQQSGASLQELSEALTSFRGVKRRQEVRAKIGSHFVIDDFAHHPTAIRHVSEGLRAKYPEHQIILFFEPRSNTSRRNVLQSLFNEAFVLADETFIAPIFKADIIPENERLDLQQIFESHRKKGRSVRHSLSTDEMIERAVQLSKQGPCVFAILSNGSFDGLHEKLISALKNQ